jgi:hypothetical protein
MTREPKRTDDFISLDKFVRRFARKNGFSIKRIAGYEFENMSGDHGLLVDFGRRGLLSFLDGWEINNNPRGTYIFGVGLVDCSPKNPNSLDYSKGYFAAGELDGRQTSMVVKVSRKNIKRSGKWSKPTEEVERFDKAKYWFYVSPSRK